MPEQTEIQPPPGHEPGKTADEIESEMNLANLAAGGRASQVEDLTFGMRTRQLLATVSPYWRKMAWWAMLFLAIVVMALDLNAWTDGAIGSALMWTHAFVFRRFPSFAFIGGMAACYYVIFKGERGPRS